MNSKQLKPILKLLRDAGVTRYQDGAVVIEMGAAPAAKASRVTAQQLPGPDTGGGDDAPPVEEITDPRAWLEAKYRAAGQ